MTFKRAIPQGLYLLLVLFLIAPDQSFSNELLSYGEGILIANSGKRFDNDWEFDPFIDEEQDRIFREDRAADEIERAKVQAERKRTRPARLKEARARLVTQFKELQANRPADGKFDVPFDDFIFRVSEGAGKPTQVLCDPMALGIRSRLQPGDEITFRFPHGYDFELPLAADGSRSEARLLVKNDVSFKFMIPITEKDMALKDSTKFTVVDVTQSRTKLQSEDGTIIYRVCSKYGREDRPCNREDFFAYNTTHHTYRAPSYGFSLSSVQKDGDTKSAELCEVNASYHPVRATDDSAGEGSRR